MILTFFAVYYFIRVTRNREILKKYFAWSEIEVNGLGVLDQEASEVINIITKVTLATLLKWKVHFNT